MIRPGSHRITKQPRMTAECDESGCESSMYLHQELGVVSAGESLQALGWQVGVYGPAGEITARCPAHAQTTQKCRHATIITVDRVGHCQRCGRRPNETKGVAA